MPSFTDSIVFLIYLFILTRGKTSFEKGGIGTEKVADVKKEDDDFEVYRKRMMLAYKFRPNPLVSFPLHESKNSLYFWTIVRKNSQEYVNLA